MKLGGFQMSNQIKSLLVSMLMVILILPGCGSGAKSTNGSSQPNAASIAPSAAPSASAGKIEDPKKKITIKLATVIADNEPINVYARKLADTVKERTKGQVEIQVYPNSSLGSNKDAYEQILAGAPVIGHGDAGYWQDYVADVGILNGPFLVKTPEDYNKLLKSDWYKDVSAQLEKKGLKLLTYNWYFGERHMISKKEIRKPADMKGLKTRVPPNVMWKETIAAMGGNPTQLEWSEVYSGLSSGVVDAAEAPLSTLYGSKLYEAAKVVSMTGHFKAMSGFVIGKSYFDTLPADVQKILVEEFDKYGVEESKAAIAQTDEWRKKLEEKGVKFVTDVDVAAFQEATKVVYTKFDKWSPGLYDKVNQILSK
jgi:tripartite ATP-independent transporter DctP family solute receptor